MNYEEEFNKALNDNLNVPKAVGILFKAKKAGEHKLFIEKLQMLGVIVEDSQATNNI